jgi:2-polyprenyl-3-methyl-5-hydroxy-6-metoxy-1,4-benzoquinol methylase
MANYKDYGFVTSQNSHIHKWLLQPLLLLLDPAKNRKILDVGCGNGWLARTLIDHGYDVYGIDASSTGIDVANGITPGRFFVQDLDTDDLPMPLQKEKFDTIVSTEVIEHIYDPRKYITFCKTVLKQTGGNELIISTPYHGYFKYLALAVSGKMDQHLNPLWMGGHIKFWSKKTISRLLTEEGFQVVDFKTCGRFPLLWKSMIVKATIKA